MWENLEDYLRPSKIKFYGNARVRLEFNFRQKNPDHVSSFSPEIGHDVKSKFRWSCRGEDYNGLRISDRGVAVIKCWFLDDVVADTKFATGTSFAARNIGGLAFVTDKMDALANNLGTQCVLFRKGKPKSRKGALKPLTIYELFDLRLSVKDGSFEATLEGRRKARLSYSQKKFKSGRVGFIWGGSMAASITSLTIKDTLDVKRTVKELKKSFRK